MSESLIQFLSLFIPAIIAVLGSYWIYQKKLAQRREALRWALLSELVFMETLEAWPKEREDPRVIPIQDLVPTTVYKSNTDKLGLLSTEEIASVVRFYSTAELVNQGIRGAHRERELSEKGTEINAASLHQDIVSLKEQRERAREVLNESINASQ